MTLPVDLDELVWKYAQDPSVVSMIAELRMARQRGEWLEAECDLWKLRALKAEALVRAARETT